MHLQYLQNQLTFVKFLRLLATYRSQRCDREDSDGVWLFHA